MNYATGQSAPTGVAVDEEDVYWITMDLTIKKAPKAGGPVTLLVEQGSGGGSAWGPIAVDETYVYWGNQGLQAVFRAPKR